MSSRALSTTIRASQRIAVSNRLVVHSGCRTFVTAKPVRTAATTSIGKMKGVEGPEISSYPPPKHLKVPSGLTPEQVNSKIGNWLISD
jgi:hypothetical protein